MAPNELLQFIYDIFEEHLMNINAFKWDTLLINKKETRSLEQKRPTFGLAGQKSVQKNLVGTKIVPK